MSEQELPPFRDDYIERHFNDAKHLTGYPFAGRDEIKIRIACGYLERGDQLRAALADFQEQYALRVQADAAILILKAENAELTRKGGELASVLGNLMIHIHDLGLRKVDDKFNYRNERAEKLLAEIDRLKAEGNCATCVENHPTADEVADEMIDNLRHNVSQDKIRRDFMQSEAPSFWGMSKPYVPEQAAVPVSRKYQVGDDYLGKRIAELRSKMTDSVYLDELLFLVDQRAYERAAPTLPKEEERQATAIELGHAIEAGRKEGWREAIGAAAKICKDFQVEYSDEIAAYSLAAERCEVRIRALAQPPASQEGEK